MKPIRLVCLAFLIIAGMAMSSCEQPEILPPHITEIIPEIVTAGQPFEITGENLAFGTYVKIDTIKLPYQIQDGNALVFLPKDFPAGNYQLLIESVEKNSNELPITILPPEIIISSDTEANVGDSLTINGENFVAPVQVILCAGSADSITINNPSIKSESKIKIFIPVEAAFDQDSKTCNIEIISNSVKSSSITITMNNPKNPKLTTTNFTDVFENDIITLEGQHLAEDGLKITIDDIPITDPVINDPTSLQIVIPTGIGKVGKIIITTKYGVVEADYSEDDASNRVPFINETESTSRVYSDDSLKIRGKNFTKYPMKVFLSTDVSPKTLLENSAYEIVNDSFLMISFPENILEGDVVLENDFGESSSFHFDVLAPPIIQISLPKSNPANGPLYIYGQDLLSVSSVIFKSINTQQETEISNIVKYSRCFDTSEIGDTCNIVTLNVPNLTPGDYEIFAIIKEGGKEIKRSKKPLPFEILTNYDGNTLAGTGNTNIVFPNPPIGTPIASVQNSWFILNDFSLYQLIEPETPPVNGVQLIYDDFNNIIGEYRKDATFVKMELQGLHYQGQFDSSYFDNDDEFYVRRMVLIPEEQGNVVILMDKNVAIDSLNSYQLHVGDEMIIYGHFLDISYDVFFHQPGKLDRAFSIDSPAETTLKLKIPENIVPGNYTVYVHGGNFGFNSNKKTITVME